MALKLGVHWFRQDLRVNHNPSIEALAKRVDKIINTILTINPKEFYENTRDICEHNYQRLCHFHFENKNKFVRQLDELFKKYVRY